MFDYGEYSSIMQYLISIFPISIFVWFLPMMTTSYLGSQQLWPSNSLSKWPEDSSATVSTPSWWMQIVTLMRELNGQRAYDTVENRLIPAVLNFHSVRLSVTYYCRRVQKWGENRVRFQMSWFSVCSITGANFQEFCGLLLSRMQNVSQQDFAFVWFYLELFTRLTIILRDSVCFSRKSRDYSRKILLCSKQTGGHWTGTNFISNMGCSKIVKLWNITNYI